MSREVQGYEVHINRTRIPFTDIYLKSKTIVAVVAVLTNINFPIIGFGKNWMLSSLIDNWRINQLYGEKI